MKEPGRRESFEVGWVQRAACLPIHTVTAPLTREFGDALGER